MCTRHVIAAFGRVASAAIIGTTVLPPAVRADLHLDVEGGLVAAAYNDVRIPNDTGTLFSLTDDLETDAKGFLRYRFTYAAGGRHTLSLLIAPLSLNASGHLDEPLVFEDSEFPAGTDLTASYRFDSYRLTYRYTLRRTDRLELGIGATAKIRDAEIALEGGQLSPEKTNTGFVPLINFRLAWSFGDWFGFLLEGDALAAPQGRAEDVLVALTATLSPNLEVRAGYRLLEGGADVDEVYNFALLNYAVLGVTVLL